MNVDLLASSVQAFPSSNDTISKGKVTNEVNLRNMIRRLNTLNYKKISTDFALSVTGTDLSIAQGMGNINGSLVEVLSALTVDCSSLSDDTYYVYIRLVYDASTHIKSPITSGGVTVSEGITCEIVNAEPVSLTDYLYLGTLEVSSGTLTATTSTTNIYPYDLTLIPNPTGDDTLENYLNVDVPNTYVSKVVNDSKEGNLEFAATGATQKVTISNTTIGVSNSGTNTLTVTEDYITKSGASTDPKFQVKSDSVDMSFSDGTHTSKTSVINTGTSAKAIMTTDTHKVEVNDTGIILDDLGVSGSTITAPTTLTLNGNLTATGDIHANRVYNAVFNDVAEMFVKSNRKDIIEAGDLVCFTTNGRVKLIENDLDVYRLCGVVSSEDTYGVCLGGMGYADDQIVPIALCGRVKLKIDKINVPLVKCGDLIAVTKDGKGLEVVEELNRRVVGKATENVKLSEKKEVIIKVG